MPGLAIPAGFNDGGRKEYRPYGTVAGAPIAGVQVGVLSVALVVTTWKSRRPEGYRVTVHKDSTRQRLRLHEFPTLAEAVTEYEGCVQDARAWRDNVARGIFPPF